MRTIVKGKNAEVPDRVREYAERKLKRIERLLDDQTDATVELWSEHHGAPRPRTSPRSRLVIHGQALRSRATGSSYQAALDAVVDKVERQAVDHKEKPRLRARPEEEKQILRRLADGSAGPAARPRIVKVKRFAIEPMFEEDAVAAMEELGHQFFVFVNAETERVAILYRAGRRRLRPHRAGHRRRLHEGPPRASDPKPPPPVPDTRIDAGVGRSADASSRRAGASVGAAP